MLPCDRDFADIERVVRKIQHIYTPTEYMDIVRKARRHNQFDVHEMTASEIKDCSSLSKCFTMGKTTVDGEKLMFRNATQMRFHTSKPSMMQVKYTYNEEETWKDVDMSKKGRGRSMKQAGVELVAKYTEPKPVARNKVDDVKSLMCYVPACHHEFYKSLRADMKKTVANDIIDFDDVLDKQ